MSQQPPYPQQGPPPGWQGPPAGYQGGPPQGYQGPGPMGPPTGPTPKRPWYQRPWGIGLLIVLGMALIGGLLGEGEDEVTAASTEATAEPAAAAPTTEPAVSLPTGGCNEPFAAEAAASDLEDTYALLTPALTSCEGVDDWVAASEANPGAIDVDPEVVLANACVNKGITATPACAEVLQRCDDDGAPNGILAACLRLPGS